MYSPFQLAFKYLHYFFTASNGRGHGIHSPFLFQFITRVLNDKKHDDAYEKVETLRHQMMKDKTVIPVQDFGAGSIYDKGAAEPFAVLQLIQQNQKNTDSCFTEW